MVNPAVKIQSRHTDCVDSWLLTRQSEDNLRRVIPLLVVAGSLAFVGQPGGARSAAVQQVGPTPTGTAVGPATATPSPTPIIFVDARLLESGRLHCNYRERPPALHPGPTRFYRTRQGVQVRLLPIPTAPHVTALTLYGSRVSWAVKSYWDRRARVRHPPRLYIANVNDFRPVLVSQDSACKTGFNDVRLSRDWLVWMRNLGGNAAQDWATDQIWALNLRTGRRVVVDFRANRSPKVADIELTPIWLHQDTVVWARSSFAKPRFSWLSIYSRRLTDWHFSDFGLRATFASDDAYASSRKLHTYLYENPQLVGATLTFTESRAGGHRVVTSVMTKDLRSGRVRDLADTADLPTTNGRKIAWLVPGGIDARRTLVRYDLQTGSTAILGRNVLNTGEVDDTPHMTDDLLTWHSFNLTAGGGSVDRLIARDLRTGRDYRLASGVYAGGARFPYTAVAGPAWGSGRRVAWVQTWYDRRGRGTSYLAVADVP